MKIIKVKPLGKGVPDSLFDYFIKDEVSIGDMVMIRFHSRDLRGEVISVEDVIQNKINIKDRSFSLQKAIKLNISIFENRRFLEILKKYADTFFYPVGKLFPLFLPSQIVQKKILKHDWVFENRKNENRPTRLFAIQKENNDRTLSLRQEIRSYLAKDTSVFVFMPTIGESNLIFPQLSHGIEEKCLLLSDNNALDTLKKIENLKREGKTFCIITTPRFAFLISVVGTGLIIIENENSNAYKNIRAPFPDFRHFIEILAKEEGADIIFSDRLLRIETLSKIENGHITEIGFLNRKMRWDNELIIEKADSLLLNDILKDKTQEKTNFITTALQFIKEKIDNKERVFVFATKRGLYSKTICFDCKRTIICKKCESPLFLHNNSLKANFFLCHNCGHTERSSILCPHCNSWNLKTFGLGSEGIQKLISDNLSSKVIRLDKDIEKTNLVFIRKIEEFLQTKKSVLVGTESALKFLKDKSVENAVLFDTASLFAIPSFRINERVADIIIKLRDISTKNVLINGREMNKNIQAFVQTGDLDRLFKDEMRERKTFGFPPFGHIFKISKKTEKDEAEKEQRSLLEAFREYDLNIMEPLRIKNSTKYIQVRGILKLKTDFYSDKKIHQLLIKAQEEKAEIEYDPINPF